MNYNIPLKIHLGLFGFMHDIELITFKISFSVKGEFKNSKSSADNLGKEMAFKNSATRSGDGCGIKRSSLGLYSDP